MKVVSRFLLFLFLFVLGVIAIGYYHTVMKPLPSYEGQIVLPELREPVSILWDDVGVPRIDANNEADLYTAVGYVHAQERLWQMTLFQWMMEGRFAEFLGPDMVETDIHQRTLGFWETAGRIAADTDPVMIQRLQAYANGVNRYASDHRDTLPPEFAMLGVTPLEWTPQHSIGMTRLMAWDQNMQWRSELVFAELRYVLGDELLESLMPVYPEDAPVSVADSLWIGAAGVLRSAEQESLAEELAHASFAHTSKLAHSFADQEQSVRKMLGRNGSVQGSNVWAVSGSRTKSGRPMLAGDPHMSLFSPGFWFEATLSAPGLMVSGATIPGAPFVILGSNPFVAWSITNSMADDTDLYLEWFHPEDPRRYLRGSNRSVGQGASPINPNILINRATQRGESAVDVVAEDVVVKDVADENVAAEADWSDEDWRDEDWRDEDWREVAVRYEVLAVKGEDDRLVEIYSTEHGPLIGRAGIGDAVAVPEGTGLALRWAGHDVSHELQSFYELQFARNVAEVRQALWHFGSPVMTFGVADAEDSIALVTAGRVPVRSGDPVGIRAGWDAAQDWRGWVGTDELPFVVNPPEGFVATANNRLHGEEYPHYVGSFWAPPYRIQRIREVLGESRSMTPEDMSKLQMDVMSEQAREWLPRMMPVVQARATETNPQLISYLENWNYRMEGTSTAASIFERWVWELSRGVFLTWMDEDTYGRLVELPQHPVLMLRRLLLEQEEIGADAPGEITPGSGDITPGSGKSALDRITLDIKIFEAYERSVRWLQEEFGDNPADWQWKNVHKVSFRPPLFSEAADQEGASAMLRLIVQNILTIGPYEAEGSSITVNNTEYDWRRPFDVTLGASIRRVVDFQRGSGLMGEAPGTVATDRSMPVTYSVLPTGQSGNPFSDSFGNQTVRWLLGDLRKLETDGVRLRSSGAREMTLVPN